MEIKEIITQLSEYVEYIKYILGFLATLGIVIEPTKIPFKPYSMIFKWIRSSYDE